MKGWRSAYELVVPGRTPEAVLRSVEGRPRHWFLPGLGVWITRDGRLRARHKAWGSKVYSPLLTGRIYAEDGQTRIVGSLSWTMVKSWQITYGICALTLLLTGLVASLHELLPGLIIALSGIGFVVLLVREVLSEDAIRESEEFRLRSGLTMILSGEDGGARTVV